jgi:signal peptidase II
MKISKKILIICLAVFFLVGCDYSSKKIAQTQLKDKSVLSYLGGNLKFIYVENSGGMLGIGDGLSEEMRFIIFGIFVAIILSVLFVYTILKKGNGKWSMVSFVLILSGGLGNLMDRILNQGKVIDFIILGGDDLHTGIFNLADFYVTTGVMIFLISGIFIKKQPLPKQE